MTTISRQTDPLAALLGSRARAEVFRVFLIDPSRAYYQRQLEQVTGLPLRAVQRELEKFTELGVLYRWAEGRRAYYQLDTRLPFFNELRAFVLKTCSGRQRLRAILAGDSAVRVAILLEFESDVLVVTEDGRHFSAEVPQPYTVRGMAADTFAAALQADPESLEPFLVRGEDLLGRRDDVIWHWIGTAGFSVRKGEDVP